MKNTKTKAKILPHRQAAVAVLIVTFAVFATTFFAMADNKNSNSLFLDSDQDGLTDQEERMIGTNPNNPDTDGDGYSDGKEVESGYNPLKPAPGDKIVATPADTATTDQAEPQTTRQPDNQTTDSSSDLLGQLNQNDTLSTDAIADLSSDPSNPNLTNEMIGQLLALTKNKAGASDTFAQNPTYSADDLSQVTQSALETTDITKSLPEVKDSELNILPDLSASGGGNKKLSADEIKAEQKTEIEKYLSQMAFVMASNSPFAIENTTNLESSLNTEGTSLVSALASGDKTKVDSYAAKAQAGIDQLKKVGVPYVLKDVHKTLLQLAIYTVDQKDNISLNASDPMKSLAAVSSLQAVAQQATSLQEQFSQILSSYGIDSINFPS